MQDRMDKPLRTYIAPALQRARLPWQSQAGSPMEQVERQKSLLDS